MRRLENKFPVTVDNKAVVADLMAGRKARALNRIMQAENGESLNQK